MAGTGSPRSLGVWSETRKETRAVQPLVWSSLLVVMMGTAVIGIWSPGDDPPPDLQGLGAMDIAHTLDSVAHAPPGQSVAIPLRAIADAHDIDVGPGPTSCPDLEQAITRHAHRFGATAVHMDLPPMPQELDEALACLLDAMHQADLAMDRTFTGLTRTDLLELYRAAGEDRPFSATLHFLLDDRDHTHNLIAATHAAESVDHALSLLDDLQTSGAPLPPLDLEPILRFSPQGHDRYERNYALTVDLEGNDLYDNHAGGVFIATGSGIWDVEEGSGFLDTSVLGQNLIVGGNVQDADAVVSSSMVLDLEGDDTYGVKHPPMLKDAERECTDEELVPMVATAGGGVIGTGMLFDLGGDDTFTGRTGTQGTGHILGVGVLYSGGGHDTFEAIRLAQGSGLLGGIGLLINKAGDNTYHARPPEGGAWNGDILICDEDSRYVQGSAFDRRAGPLLPSVGILADLAGHNDYSSWRKAHGFGQGPGLSLLYDRNGADTYQARELAQGAAQGRNADTHPQAPWGGGQAVLYDRTGDDTYTLTGGDHGYRGQGYSLGQPELEPLPEPHEAVAWALARNEAIALHLDTRGTDTYQGPDGRGDATVHLDGLIGLFVDPETSDTP